MKRGDLAMWVENNQFDSEFGIVFRPAPSINGKHCVVGQVIDGMMVLDALENVEKRENTDGDLAIPIQPCTIADCGQLA